MLDVKLAKKVLKAIRKYPERHDQDSFIGEESSTLDDFKKPSCGTTACIAGWAAALTAPKGTRWDWRHNNLLLPDGSIEDVERYAKEKLGLDRGQASAIFYCFDNATAIKRLEYLMENPGATSSEIRRHAPDPDGD